MLRFVTFFIDPSKRNVIKKYIRILISQNLEGRTPLQAGSHVCDHQGDVERVFGHDSLESAVADVVARFASGAVELKLLGLLLRQGVHDVLELEGLCILHEFPDLDSSLVDDTVVVGHNLWVSVK